MFNLTNIDDSWKAIITKALDNVAVDYLQELQQHTWLPGPDSLFNAFSLPLANTKYILFGESPYPRAASANGYAFWDGAVDSLWADKGLSTAVNRATSLRNFIKMLLLTRGDLTADDLSQGAIAALSKTNYVANIGGLFNNLLQHGFLLLNVSLVLSDNSVRSDARAWRGFMASLLEQLGKIKPDLQLILFGKVAADVLQLPTENFQILQAEHPYNISFIHNQTVQAFFAKLDLLKRG